MQALSALQTTSSKAAQVENTLQRDDAHLHESGTSIVEEARSSLRLAWPTVEKPCTVAIMKGPVERSPRTTGREIMNAIWEDVCVET